MGRSPYQFEGTASPASTANFEIPVHSLQKGRNSLQREAVAKTRKAGACENCRRRKVRCTHSNLELAFTKQSPARRDHLRNIDPSSIIEVQGTDIFGMKAQATTPVKINMDISSLFPSTPSKVTFSPISPSTPSITYTPTTGQNSSRRPRPLPALSPMQIYSISGKRQLSNISLAPSEEAIRPPRKNLKNSWGRAMGKAMLGKLAVLNSLRIPSGNGPPGADGEVDIADRLSMCSLDNSPNPSVNDLTTGGVGDSPQGSVMHWQEDSSCDHSDRTDPRSPGGWMEYLLTPKVGESANSWIHEGDDTVMYEDDEEEFVFGLGISTGEMASAVFPERTSSLAAKTVDWDGVLDGEWLKDTPPKAMQKLEKFLSQKRKQAE